ncbi:MAG: hypothetical protein LBE34_09240 [Flavobacteriaceae bacterium]|jgi:hypothetical protein|nr:hypothetical protein [Flavobacteriaceae bacterium]
MANRAYLFFINKSSEWEAIENISNVPSLWQELCSIELLLQQRERIERELLLRAEDHNEGIEDERDIYIKIPKNIALDNLRKHINQNNEEECADRTQLRKDFYSFLEEEVSVRGDGIQIDISEIYDLCDTYYDCLLSFHMDETYYQKVIQSEYKIYMIGYCDTFLKYSELYKQWKEDATAKNKEYFNRRAKYERRVRWKEFIENVLLFLFSLVFSGVGVFTFIVQVDYKVSISALLLGFPGVLIFGYNVLEIIKEVKK